VCVRQDGLPGLSRRHGSPDRLDRQVRLASCLSRCKGGGVRVRVRDRCGWQAAFPGVPREPAGVCERVQLRAELLKRLACACSWRAVLLCCYVPLLRGVLAA